MVARYNYKISLRLQDMKFSWDHSPLQLSCEGVLMAPPHHHLLLLLLLLTPLLPLHAPVMGAPHPDDDSALLLLLVNLALCIVAITTLDVHQCLTSQHFQDASFRGVCVPKILGPSFSHHPCQEPQERWLL